MKNVALLLLLLIFYGLGHAKSAIIPDAKYDDVTIEEWIKWKGLTSPGSPQEMLEQIRQHANNDPWAAGYFFLLASGGQYGDPISFNLKQLAQHAVSLGNSHMACRLGTGKREHDGVPKLSKDEIGRYFKEAVLLGSRRCNTVDAIASLRSQPTNTRIVMALPVTYKRQSVISIRRLKMVSQWPCIVLPAGM